MLTVENVITPLQSHAAIVAWLESNEVAVKTASRHIKDVTSKRFQWGLFHIDDLPLFSFLNHRSPDELSTHSANSRYCCYGRQLIQILVGPIPIAFNPV